MNVRVAVLRSAFVAASAACVLLLAPSTAPAQGVIAKTPGPPATDGGPGVGYQVPAGSRMEWIINVPPTGFPLNFIDEPQATECNAGGTSRYGTPGNSAESAPQPVLRYLDTNGDGNCQETVISVPGAALVECDKLLERLIIRNIPGTGGQLRFITEVDPLANPSERACNWGHFTNPTLDPLDPSALRQSTGAPGGAVPGCTCVTITPPSGISFDATKTAAPETLPLIPGDGNSTIVYTVTLTNTGTENLNNVTFNDNFTPADGLEWVDVVDCPAGLTCEVLSPTRLRVTGWNVPAADPDESQTIQVRARVTCAAATDDDTGQVCNQGTFSAGLLSVDTDDPSTTAPLDPTCVPVVFSNLTQTEKRFDSYTDANGNGQLDAGERVRFLILARNTGRMGAKNVTVVDDLTSSTCFDQSSIQVEDGGTETGGVITWIIGDLPAVFGRAEVHFSVVLSADTLCCNQATIQSDERVNCGLGPLPTDDPTTPALDDAACVSPGPQPNLRVTKDWCVEPPPGGGCPGTPASGGATRWTVTITNNGAGAATGAQFLDILNQNPCLFGFDGNVTLTTTGAGGDAGTNNSTAYAPGFPPNLGTVQIDDLGGADGIQPGETITIEFVTTNAGGSINGCCNQGNVTYAERPSPVLTDDPVTVGQVDDATCLQRPVPGPAGTLQKTVTPLDLNTDGFISAGDEFEWVLTFTNTGDVDLTNVVISDLSSSCQEFDIATVVINPPANGTNNSLGTTVTVNVVSPIAPAQSVTITVRGRITATVAGDCCNQATWTSTEVPGPSQSDLDPSDFVPDQPTCSPVTVVPTPDIAMNVTKSNDSAGACLLPGSQVAYTVIVENTGADPVAGWSLSDPLPAGLTNIAVDPPLTLTGTTVELTAGPSLASGETRTYTYRAEVPCDSGGQLTNTATLTYNNGTSDVTKDSATQVQWGQANFSTSTKVLDSFDSNGNGYNEAGEDVQYTITVNNTGTCAARNVTVTDTLDARFDPATVAFSAGDTGTVAASTITWDSTTVPELASVAPGTPVTLTFTVRVIPATTPDQRIPNNFAVDAPDMVANCPGQSVRHQAAATGANGGQVQWEQIVPGGVQLLRNAMISCRYYTGFQTLHQQVDGAPVAPPQAPRDLAATDPTPPYTATGDADPANVNRTCPQLDLSVPGNRNNRAVVYYLLDDPAITDLRVTRSGGDVVLNWTP